MAARASRKQSKSSAKTAKKKTARKAGSKGTARKAAAKSTAKKAARPAKKSKPAPRKATSARTASRTRPAAKSARPAPAGTGMLVHTRMLGVSKRLLGPTTTADGGAASGHIIHTNPARDAVLKRLLG